MLPYRDDQSENRSEQRCAVKLIMTAVRDGKGFTSRSSPLSSHSLCQPGNENRIPTTTAARTTEAILSIDSLACMISAEDQMLRPPRQAHTTIDCEEVYESFLKAEDPSKAYINPLNTIPSLNFALAQIKFRGSWYGWKCFARPAESLLHTQRLPPLLTQSPKYPDRT